MGWGESARRTLQPLRSECEHRAAPERVAAQRDAPEGEPALQPRKQRGGGGASGARGHLLLFAARGARRPSELDLDRRRAAAAAAAANQRSLAPLDGLQQGEVAAQFLHTRGRLVTARLLVRLRRWVAAEGKRRGVEGQRRAVEVAGERLCARVFWWAKASGACGCAEARAGARRTLERSVCSTSTTSAPLAASESASDCEVSRLAVRPCEKTTTGSECSGAGWAARCAGIVTAFQWSRTQAGRYGRSGGGDAMAMNARERPAAGNAM